MKIKHINLNFSKANTDKAAKIKHISLVKNKEIGYYVAQVDNFVQAHYHKKGDEIYHILKGRGLIYLGRLTKNLVRWERPKKIYKDDVIFVPAGYAHCLMNSRKEPLVLAFICPPLHLSKDRKVVNNPK
ncbi:MAG: cupin domain-containing protein [Patescibacteria group bacterium]|nr:cupin domain-containing protein [Patescibacteria group bacterium]